MLSIEHAFRVLDWHENLPSEDMPPEWMWPIDHELVEWFEGVEDRRKAKYSGGSDDEESSTMISNEWAKERRQ